MMCYNGIIKLIEEDELKIKKIALIAINSQYTHTNLAVHYIKSALDNQSVVKECSAYQTVIIEDNINSPLNDVYSKIIGTGADIFAFSTYIFNIEYIKQLAVALKKDNGEKLVIFGGIEAENDAEALSQYCDYLLKGAGEKVFPLFMDYELGENGKKCNDFIFGDLKCRNKIVELAETEKCKGQIFKINSPYTEEYFESVRGRIAYFEATRGCPFNCSYCMSGGTGVQYFDVEFVKEELAKFFGRDIKVLKFVDRTFNLPNKYSKEILRFIIENESKFSFGIHFEAAPELFDNEYFDIISKSKSGRLQFEIGMQTLNEKSLNAINRKNDAEKIVKNITALKKLNNCAIHCDLIAGLPFEDTKSFSESFDLLYLLRPTEIQVGALKVLKGSKIKIDIDASVGYEYEKTPPYTIIKTPDMTEIELKKIRLTEIAVNKLYNCGRFKRTLDYLVVGSPFAFFLDFADYIGDLNGKQLFEIIGDILRYATEKLKFGEEKIYLLKEIMRMDYYLTNKSKITPPRLFREYTKAFTENRKQLNEGKNTFCFEIGANITENGGRFEAKKIKNPLIISVDYSEYKNIVKEFGWRVVKLLD